MPVKVNQFAWRYLIPEFLRNVESLELVLSIFLWNALKDVDVSFVIIWIKLLKISAMAVVSVLRCKPVNRIPIICLFIPFSDLSNVASLVFQRYLVSKSFLCVGFSWDLWYQIRVSCSVRHGYSVCIAHTLVKVVCLWVERLLCSGSSVSSHI